MIPLLLRISGFLSYRDSTELDFTPFDLACISGHNGAGKSSLLDAITWSLFGEARGRSTDVINLHAEVKAAEVALTFMHEGNTYRVQRTLPRGKSTVLEFQVLHTLPEGEGEWRPLTEKTTRETQARIEGTLRLDYETFVNASFFLQGRADQFTQQNAGKRKDVLGNILGLEIWEEYKSRTAEKRKRIEAEVETIEGRIAEIDSELAEEEARSIRLKELQDLLSQLSSAREAQESLLQNLKRNAALLEEQRKLTSTLSAGIERARTSLATLESRLGKRQADRASHLDLVQRAKEIESTYRAWQKARRDLEALDKVAAEFHGHQTDRAALQEHIAVEKARLEEERRGLTAEADELDQQKPEIDELGSAITAKQSLLREAEEKVKTRIELEIQRGYSRERQAALKVENESLKTEMNVLKDRIETLKAARGAICPLCGQELSGEHRTSTLRQLEEEGRQKGDAYRANQKESSDLVDTISGIDRQITGLSGAENDRLNLAAEVSGFTERLDRLKSTAKEWEATGRKRLKEIDKALENGKYAVEEQKKLTRLDKELAKLGYDASAHDAAREAEAGLRSAEDEYVNLKSAKDVSRQIEGEIANLESEIADREAEIETIEAEYKTAQTSLETLEAHTPNLEQAERELFHLREEENRRRGEVGGAQQRVDVLRTQRERKAGYEQGREKLGGEIARHRTLETALGRNGVPALLIEQALPQIEEKANELLGRLTNDQMSIEFVTQEKFKDEKRKDLRETLEIRIKDGAGWRDYEMYSGGEAFRVDFAIRLALSEILAQRKGARLQTLVIDEGFGSQDAQGRQRLIEAINLVKPDFAKILVITHLDELKDAFPTRIEVEKTERGSTLQVM